MKTDKFKLIGMSCASCAQTIEHTLKRSDGVGEVAINIASDMAKITYDEALIDASAIIAVIQSSGYDATLLSTALKKASGNVIGMTCSSCASSIDHVVNQIEGITNVSVNVATDMIHFTYDIELVRLSAVKKVVQDIGYDIIYQNSASESKDIELEQMNKARKKLIISGSISAVMMSLMVIHMFIVEIPFYTVIVALLGFPVIFILGSHVHKASIKSLKAKRPNMDVLVSLGSIPPYLIGLLGLFIPITTFIEMATTIMTFHLIGKYLESRAKGKASQAIKKLIALGAKSAKILVDGKELEVDVSELQVGDLMVIRPGEKIPTDGVVAFGTTLIDESLATGESMPLVKTIGDEVIGATINQQALIHVKVTKIGNDTFLAQVIELVESCQGTKVPIQEFADKITGYFVPGILVVTLLSFVSFLVFPAFHLSILTAASNILPWVNPNQTQLTLAFVTATAVLVIACPCALGLGTPTALMVGSGIGAEKGILIRNGEAVQTLKDIKAIAFDKTGTLTYGKPAVTNVVSFGVTKLQVLQYAYDLEQGSNHPLAFAIIQEAQKQSLEPAQMDQIENVTGKGVIGYLGDKTLIVGNRKLMEEYNINYQGVDSDMTRLEDEAKTVMMVAYQSIVVGLIAVADEIKANAYETILEIERLGIVTAMITGDNARTAQAIAKKAGITRVISDVLPEGKVSEVMALQAEFGFVAMVGDGINDAPALKQANVGLAIGTGTDIAIEAADVTLVRGDIATILVAIRLSKAIFQKIKQNYFWAWFYNVIAIPFAMLGLLHPMIGAAAMSISSLNVIYNSMRLKKINFEKKVGIAYETR